MADVRVEPSLRVSLAHGTVLRQRKHTFEVWTRQRRTVGMEWQNLMARKLPNGKPFVLVDTGRGNKHWSSIAGKIWIQSTFGDLLSYYRYQHNWQRGMSHGSDFSGYSMVTLRGATATSTLLSEATLRQAQQTWKAHCRREGTKNWAKSRRNDPTLFSRNSYWESFGLTLRFPGQPGSDEITVENQTIANLRMNDDSVAPSRRHVPGLFLQNYLMVGYWATNHMMYPFAMRMATVPRALKHHAPKPGTTLVAAPDGCASVDLQTNEVVSPKGLRRRLLGVSKIIGVTWIPGQDPFRVRQLRAAEIEAAPSLRRARAYEKKKQYTKAAEHYLHGGRLLVTVGARHAAAAKVFQRALRLPFKRKRLRVKLHSEQGWALFSAGRLDQATRVLRAGLALKPSLRFKGALLYNLGRIAEKRGKLLHAKRLYRGSVMVRADRTAINRLRSVMRRLRRSRRSRIGPRVQGGSRK